MPFFEARIPSLFILPALLGRLLALNLSLKIGAHTGGRADTHTLMHEHTEAQRNLRLWCTHATHTSREADAGGTHQQAITPHMHPSAHTHLFKPL